MHHRLLVRLVPLAAILLAAGGCSSGNSGITDPPPTTTVTETFTGTLTLNGARTHNFLVTAPGSINALLHTLEPDPTLLVGLSLGTWNGSICQVVLSNDASKQGSVVVGQTQATGDFCVRIYDASGTVVVAQSYVLEVSHQVANP